MDNNHKDTFYDLERSITAKYPNVEFNTDANIVCIVHKSFREHGIVCPCRPKAKIPCPCSQVDRLQYGDLQECGCGYLVRKLGDWEESS